MNIAEFLCPAGRRNRGQRRLGRNHCRSRQSYGQHFRLFCSGDRANGLTGTLALAKGTLDLSGAAAATNIFIQSGALANAGSYAGTDTNKVHVNAVADSGNIALGGLDAAGLGSVVTASAGTQLTGLKQGSTWTVKGTDSSLAVGAGNISGDPFSGEDFLIQFEGHGG